MHLASLSETTSPCKDLARKGLRNAVGRSLDRFNAQMAVPTELNVVATLVVDFVEGSEQYRTHFSCPSRSV
jgi:hypothetical protein